MLFQTYKSKGRMKMNIMDNDLLSMQEARILAENSKEAQKILATYSQEKLDLIIEKVVKKLKDNVNELADDLYEETDFGIREDKVIKLNFMLDRVVEKLKDMRCVGIISEDKHQKITNIGVPIGVIVAFCSEENPITTLIYKLLIALKSGNSIIFILQKISKKQ